MKSTLDVRGMELLQEMDIAVITVAVPSDVTRKLMEVLEQKRWHLAKAHFDTYISETRRPSIGSQIKRAEACFAFVDFDEQLEGAMQSAQYLKQILRDKVHVIALSKDGGPASILKAMRAGYSEYLTKPVKEDALIAMLERLESGLKPRSEEATTPNTVLTFLGAKGGVGTTTLAVHLATYLAKYHDKKTLLIDQRAELGHACIYLGLDGSNYNFQEVVRNVARLDSELLHGFVARHPSGLDVISSPDILGGKRPMEREAIAQAIEFLRTEYDYIVVDADAQDDLNAPFLEVSSCLYLVGAPEVGAIRDLSRHVDKFISTDKIMEKLQIVVNRATSSAAISIEQIEKAMKLSVAVSVPMYPELARAENLGEPVMVESNSSFAEAIAGWADKLVGQRRKVAPAKKERRLFGAWRQSATAY